MIEKILNKNFVILNSESKTKQEALEEISKAAFDLKIMKSYEKILQSFNNREEEFSTGLEDGFAIPHAKNEEIKKPAIFIVKYKHDLEWKTLDDSKVKVVVALLIPQNSTKDHLALLSSVSQKLLDSNVKEVLKTSDTPQEIINILSKKNEVVQDVKNYEGYLIAITGCPAGVAHTYMAAKKIEEFAQSKNWKVKVEKQGAAGFEDKLTDDDVKNANVLLISSDINPGEIERFEHIPTVKTTVAEPVYNMDKIWEKILKEKRTVENQNLTEEKEEEKQKFNFKTSFKKQSQTLKNSVLTGISYVVPIIVAGTTIMALVNIISLIFGSDTIANNANWLNNLSSVSGGALSILMAPILAGYIAYALADKPGLFPGLLGGLACNAVILENDQGMEIVSGLGFLGGLIAGIITGYLMLAAKKWVTSKKFQGVLTWFVYPVFGSLIIICLILFAIGTPIALLINVIFNGLMNLQNTGFTVVLGLLIGMMCVFDLGGPVNKVAWAFSFTLFTGAFNPETGEIVNAPLLAPYTAFWAAGIGTGWTTAIVSLVCRKSMNKEELEAGKISWIMSSLGITEGSIPMMIGDPFRVIPSFMIGGAVAGSLSYAFNLGSTVLGGGLITGAGMTSITDGVPIWGAILLFLLVALIGCAISSGMIIGLKLLHLKPQAEAKAGRILAQIFTLGIINVKFKKNKAKQKK